MNEETLLSLMPTKVITEDDVNKEIEEQRGIIQSGKLFVSRLSINRFLYTKLEQFSFDETLNLFSELSDADFVINENELHFSDLDIESFAVILEETFNLDDMYELDNLYIENLLKGNDITKQDIDIYNDGETVSFNDILTNFVFHTGGMSMGDTPNLVMMLTVKKALLGAYLAEKNVESLLNGQKKIYDVSILF